MGTYLTIATDGRSILDHLDLPMGIAPSGGAVCVHTAGLPSHPNDLPTYSHSYTRARRRGAVCTQREPLEGAGRAAWTFVFAEQVWIEIRRVVSS
ncbi:MAG: hypothetical protein IPK82_30010 [Polyangiaceae bacterium]|nr:hypothetical protein [Polyangiaceae bacterium]